MNQFQVDIPINAWIVASKEEVDDVLLHGGKIIVMTEDLPDYLQSPQYGTSSLVANCLLPNYEAVSYYIENDFSNFDLVYGEMLMSPESTVYFMTMISAMINNIPLGIIFGNEEIEQAAAIRFLNFFAGMYGIHLGHNIPFAGENPVPIGWMDRVFVPKNLSMLYLNNLLTPQEFLYVYPMDTRIDPNALQKLMFDLRPPIRNLNDLNEIEGYFNDLRTNIRSANKVLIDPLVMS